jgi:hypothetical protein
MPERGTQKNDDTRLTPYVTGCRNVPLRDPFLGRENAANLLESKAISGASAPVIKNAFGAQVPALHTPTHSASGEEPRHAQTVLEAVRPHPLARPGPVTSSDDSRVRREVEEARQALLRIAEQASDAQRRLLQLEKLLEEKWSMLGTLLHEMKQLELERQDALSLAQRFAAVEWADDAPGADEGDSSGLPDSLGRYSSAL